MRTAPVKVAPCCGQFNWSSLLRHVAPCRLLTRNSLEKNEIVHVTAAVSTRRFVLLIIVSTNGQSVVASCGATGQTGRSGWVIEPV